jgi:hypothetical protein
MINALIIYLDDQGVHLRFLVDGTWQNPNRITAAQGRIVTVSAVRRHVV